MDPDTARARIEARIAELEHLAGASAEDSKPVELDQARVGRLSRVDALQSRAMSAETARRRRVELTKLRAALGRLDEGEYGDCAACGEPIAERRLEHDPGAATCIACARGAERLA